MWAQGEKSSRWGWGRLSPARTILTHYTGAHPASSPFFILYPKNPFRFGFFFYQNREFSLAFVLQSEVWDLPSLALYSIHPPSLINSWDNLPQARPGLPPRSGTSAALCPSRSCTTQIFSESGNPRSRGSRVQHWHHWHWGR